MLIRYDNDDSWAVLEREQTGQGLLNEIGLKITIMQYNTS